MQLKYGMKENNRYYCGKEGMMGVYSDCTNIDCKYFNVENKEHCEAKTYNDMKKINCPHLLPPQGKEPTPYA